MTPNISNLTEKGQATIPVEIRRHLNLKKGDRVAFTIEGDKVVVRKAEPIDFAYLSGVEGQMAEWFSEGDSKAYDDL